MPRGEAKAPQHWRQGAFEDTDVLLSGPDNFDLESSHVIPALIRKCLETVERREPEIVCWGDGTPTREFLYVADCADAIVLAAERYDGTEPVNIGAEIEISIKELVELMVELTGFQGQIVWDTSKPNGQPRRCLDTAERGSGLAFGRRPLSARDFAAPLHGIPRGRRSASWSLPPVADETSPHLFLQPLILPRFWSHRPAPD